MRYTIAALLLVLPGIALAAPAPVKRVAAKFPAGPAMAKVSTACGGCHAPDIVLNARKSRAQWEKSVDMMIDRGAKVSDAEYDGVVDYLVKNFGTGK
jgi:mono/diheme cytochrome c family protein